MSLKMFTVYDSKADSFIQPFFSQSTGTAIREFSAACNKQDHQFSKYAGDYTLFELGEFNQDTAKFQLAQSPLNLGLAITFIEPAAGIGQAPAEVSAIHRTEKG